MLRGATAGAWGTIAGTFLPKRARGGSLLAGTGTADPKIQGRRAGADGGEAVVKPLEDGSKAVGLLNPGSELAKVTIVWSTLGRKGKQQVRDLWRQKDLGVHSEEFTAEVRPHGVVLVRLIPHAAR